MLFVVGGVLPVLLVPALWVWMAETLQPSERKVEKRHSTWDILFGGGRKWPTLLLWAAFLPTVLILYLILNWLSSLVVAKGFAATVAPQSAVAFNFVAVPGAILFARLVDKFGTRTPLVVAYIGLIATLVALGPATSLGMIVFLSGMVGFFLLGAKYALYGVAASYYPLEMRGTGSGASVAMSRVGSIIGPLLGGVLLSGGATATNVVQYMAPIAAVAGVAVVVLSLFPRAVGGEFKRMAAFGPKANKRRKASENSAARNPALRKAPRLAPDVDPSSCHRVRRLPYCSFHLRMLIVRYGFGIRSERRLCEQVLLNLAYRWFCSLGLQDQVPDHSTFPKNRHGRFRCSDASGRVFESRRPPPGFYFAQ